MLPIAHSLALRRWFAGLIESNFQSELGLADPALLEYLTALLTDFIHVDRIQTVPDGSDRRTEDLATLLADPGFSSRDAEHERRREIHRHIGDFTLFWTGVYPENLRRMHRRSVRDGLLDYFQQGKRSYRIASNLSDEDSAPPAWILQMLSEEFETCVYGLGLVRREWERSAKLSKRPGLTG